MSQLIAHKYDGFWACMDTFKEQQQLDDMYSQGKAPWEVWKFSDMEKNPLKPYSKYDEQVLNSDHHSE